ncbi:flagellar motor protein MotB [Flavobacterium plurextorum]|uniref:Flagellar motor protein MotB n=1 Tax=Flavobacterium plurextorum TaxID=1114867 RepID=A0ABX4CR84_9FLAO|nr:OmpA family protein [Flavobacterium plurextorum]OXB03356.1 flagellar motor protein MotB [Flavobacterium plurextorum]
MKKIIAIGALIIFNAFSANIYCQKDLSSGDKDFERYAFIDAIKTYERIAAKGFKSESMFKRLGDSYYYNSQYKDAAKWYGELYAINDQQDSEYDYRYAQCLKSAGQIKKANEIMQRFRDKNKNDSRSALIKEDKNYIKKINLNSGRYAINDCTFNSAYSDYGAFVKSGKIYFTSARDTGNFVKSKHRWTGQYFTHIYVADIDSSRGQNPKRKPEKVTISSNSKFNESSLIFTKDGKTAYFTGNNFSNGKLKKNHKGISLLKIYSGKVEKDNITEVKELPFNTDDYSSAHPALSADEKTLFFVSDRPGTLGQSDIFKVSINDGLFGEVKNLGSGINTEGRESYPFISDEGEIYFASDGHPGLGGLDVFVGKFQDDDTVGFIQNIGSDINTSGDDFAYIIDSKSRKGYFSSNRNDSGTDEIYSFLETKKIIPEREELNGYVIDSETGLLLPGAALELYDANMILKSKVIADSTANYSFFVEAGDSYILRASIQDYFTKELKFKTGKQSKKKEFIVELDKSKCRIAVGDDLGKCFGIKMIYFDLNKSEIKKDEVFELEKILDVMVKHPSLKLDIRSHTDSRNTAKYNQALSDRRAKSTLEWLIKNGIAPERLTAGGFGESELLNNCTDGVKCTEEEHGKNRRSEFIIREL